MVSSKLTGCGGERSTRAVVVAGLGRRVRTWNGIGRGGRRGRCSPAGIRSAVRDDDRRGTE